MVIGVRSFVVLGLVTLIPLAESQPSYTIQTVAGSGVVSDPGPALAAVLSQTEGVAVDVAGNVYVADAADNRVRKIAIDGTIRTIAGTGVPGFHGDGGPAAQAQLNQPYGLALDLQGNLYIADLGNARVRKVLLDGSIQTVAGGGSIAPGSSDGGPAAIAQLIAPRNIAVDPDGTLYVSDFGAQRVYRVTSAGILNTLAGTGKTGFFGDGAAAVLAQLNSPAGLASDDSGAVYIADSGNNRVRKVFGGVITTVYSVTAPTGVALSSSGVLYIASVNYFGTAFKAVTGIASALDVAVDRSGNVYATTGQLVVELGSGKVSTIAGSGASTYFGGDNGPASLARLHQPSGFALDDLGNWYVADTGNNRIRRVSSAGIISTIAGTGIAGSSGDNGPALLAQLNSPNSVAIDSQRNIYIADTGNNRVRKITPAGIVVSLTAQLSNPEYVSLDADGTLYIADTGNNRIVKIAASGLTSTVAQVLKPAAVTVDHAGNIYACELTRISRTTPSGVVTTIVDGLNSPAGLALTAAGDLLFAEAGANVVRRWSGGVLSTIAGTGIAGFSGDGSWASSAQLYSPTDVATDLTGTVWVADSGNQRIRALAPVAVADVIANVALVNSASMAAGDVAPGEIITIFGAGFDPAATQLLFDRQPATVFYSGASQINAMVPTGLVANSKTNITIQVQGATVADFFSNVVSAAPGIFTANGTGQAAATNEDGSYNSASNPAARGSVVVLYATGQGPDVSTAMLKIGGYSAALSYAGPAPGFPGLMQINAQIPAGFAPIGVLPVVLTIETASSQAGVTIAVR